MKKTVKKLTAVGLVLTSVAGLVACTKPADNPKESGAETAKKPTTIKVMSDDTIVKVDNGAEQFYTYLEGLLEKYGDAGKIDLQFTRPDHNTYYPSVANAMNSNSKPDVLLLSSDYYALYASQDMLWDMTSAWDQSETKKSGRLISAANDVLAALLVNGSDGNKHMYGFSPYRGNGCCTYLKKAWLDKAGIATSDVEGKTLTFAQYYDILKKMKAADSSHQFVISAPGFISDEAPYTNYLPEFYQKANYTFYKDSSGKYVDGFTQQEMKDALQRIQTAVNDGIMDKASLGQKTADARNKFYSTDPKSESGVFTYWAGNWANTLKTNLEGKGLDGTLIAINPIQELGKYVERIAPAWCITKNATNPEGIFKYFIDTMLDGGDIQMAWEYGAKGTHWDTKAETYTLATAKAGEAVKEYTAKEGEFHFLPQPEKPSTLMSKNHIDPQLALATFNGTDPGNAAMTEVARVNGEFFSKNSAVAVALPMTDTLANNIGDINVARNEVISKVSTGQMTVDDGMKDYESKVGAKVKEVLESLNALK